MYKIQSLHIYPVKGMPGIQIQEAKLQPEGFQYDRRWMLVDENGTFISQRNLPLLVSAEIKLKGEELTIKVNESTILVYYNKYSDQELDVSVFENEMKANEVDPKISKILSAALNKNVRLVQVSLATNRTKNFTKHIANWDIDLTSIPHSTKVSFADGYPYLIVGTASMELLNQKLPKPFKTDRFRANIIVKTEVAHVEDQWKKITIGDQKILGIKQCARCQVTTIDQQTGAKGKEPLLTLSKYRKINNKVMFGQNAMSLTEGILKVGDEIIID